MMKLKSAEIRMWARFTFSRIMPRYWCSVGCLLTALALGFAGCAPTVNEQKGMAGVGENTTLTPGSAERKEAPRLASAKQDVPQAAILRVQDLSVREESGQTILQLKLTIPISQYRHFPLAQPARVVVDMFGDSTRQSDIETFRVGASAVSTVSFSSGEGYLRMTIEPSTSTVPPYVITPEEGGIKVVFGFSDPKASDKRVFDLVKGGRKIEARTAAGGAGSPDTGQATSPKEETTVEGKKYVGQKLSLDFKDADIKNVFRLLADVSGKNIVVTDDVNRKITVRLVEIPWDQAMDLIIDTNGLGKEEVENVIRISTAGRLKSERDALSAAKKSEENLEPLQTAYFTVNYARVIKGKDERDSTDKDLLDKLKAVLSPRGKVEADQRTNTLIIRDIKKNIEDAQSLIAKLDIRTPQVLIESNLIETSPTFSRALGIQMETLFNKGRVRTSTRFRADPPFNDSSLTFFENATPQFNPATGFSFAYLGNNVAALLSAAEAEGNVKIISRPSVVTLNNVESQIESANIVRVRTGAATVGEAGSIREIRAGIILNVTPQVSADGFVLLRITVKSSTLDFGRTVDGIPQENTREAKANVLVRDGETVVIGGIMKDTSSNSDTGIPYLKDIPVFGWLFKKSSWQKDFEELVVFITPRVIAAGSENLPMAEQMWRDQMKQTQGSATVSRTQKP